MQPLQRQNAYLGKAVTLSGDAGHLIQGGWSPSLGKAATFTADSGHLNRGGRSPYPAKAITFSGEGDRLYRGRQSPGPGKAVTISREGGHFHGERQSPSLGEAVTLLERGVTLPRETICPAGSILDRCAALYKGLLCSFYNFALYKDFAGCVRLPRCAPQGAH